MSSFFPPNPSGDGGDQEMYELDPSDDDSSSEDEPPQQGKKRDADEMQAKERNRAKAIARKRLQGARFARLRNLIDTAPELAVTTTLMAQPVPIGTGNSSGGPVTNPVISPVSNPVANPATPVILVTNPAMDVQPVGNPSGGSTSPAITTVYSPPPNPGKQEQSGGPAVDTVNIPPPPLTFYFMDVGQGSGTLVICPHGEKILIDLGCVSGTSFDEDGNKIKVQELIKTNVSAFLDDKTGKKLDYLIVTHGDIDHLSMIEPVLTGYTVDHVICGGSSKQYYGRLGKVLTAKATYLYPDDDKYTFYSEPPDAPNKTVKIKEVEVFIVGANAPGDHSNKKDTSKDKADTAKLKEFLSDDTRQAINPGTDTNASSIILLFRYLKEQVIISADATFSSEYEVLKNPLSKWTPELLDSYALIGGHHGSSDSFSVKWLQAVNPAWVLLSADLKGSYAHPTEEVVQRIVNTCKYLRNPAYEAWGPHGIVVGARVAPVGELEQLESDLAKTLRDASPMLAKLKELKDLYDKQPDPNIPADKCTWNEDGKSRALPVGWMFALAMLSQVAGQFEELMGAQRPPTMILSSWEDLTPAWNAVSQKTKKEGEPDEGVVIPMLRYYVGALNPDLSGGLPPLAYWANQFRRFEEEHARVAKIKDTVLSEDKSVKSKGHYAVWNWLVTRYNLFTTMEHANSGVYWKLEIRDVGAATTERM